MRPKPRTRKSPRQQPILWHVLNRLVIALILLALVTLLFFFFKPEWNKLQSMTSTRNDLRKQIQQETIRQQQLQREIHLLQTDPEYVENIARDKLDLMKQGETIFRLDGKTATEK